jgi:transcriptional regulator with XRE-family HTH domain
MQLKRHRLAAGKTREKVAKDAGVSRSFIGQLERGETGAAADNIKPLATAYRITTDELARILTEQEAARNAARKQGTVSGTGTVSGAGNLAGTGAST